MHRDWYPERERESIILHNYSKVHEAASTEQRVISSKDFKWIDTEPKRMEQELCFQSVHVNSGSFSHPQDDKTSLNLNEMNNS